MEFILKRKGIKVSEKVNYRKIFAYLLYTTLKHSKTLNINH